jgi:hypothetical protein
MEQMDPRTIFENEPVTFEDVSEGDFVAAPGWSRPRRVELCETRNGRGVLFLAEPDTSRIDVNRCRMVEEADFERRGTWTRYPELRKLFDRAHA